MLSTAEILSSNVNVLVNVLPVISLYETQVLGILAAGNELINECNKRNWKKHNWNNYAK